MTATATASSSSSSSSSGSTTCGCDAIAANTYYVNPNPSGPTCGTNYTGADNCPFPSITYATEVVTLPFDGGPGPSDGGHITLELAATTYSASQTGEVFPLVVPEYVEIIGGSVTTNRDAFIIDVTGGGAVPLDDGGSAAIGIELRGSIRHLTLTDSANSAIIVAIAQSLGSPSLSDTSISYGDVGVLVTATNALGGVPNVSISDCDINQAASDGIVVTSSPNGKRAPTLTLSNDTSIRNCGNDGVLVIGSQGASGSKDPSVTLGAACETSNTPIASSIYCNGYDGVEDQNMRGNFSIIATGVRWANDPPVVRAFVNLTTVDLSDNTLIQAGCPAAAMSGCGPPPSSAGVGSGNGP